MKTSEILQVLLKEYEVLRAEQGRRFETIDRMTNYIILITMGIASATITLPETILSRMLNSILFPFTPIFISPVVFGYLYNELMIFRIGRYIYNALRLEICKNTGTNLLEWDNFNSKEAKKFFSLIMTFFRNLILVLPLLIPFLISIFLISEKTLFIEILIGIDSIILVAVFAIIIYKAVYFINVVNKIKKEKSS